MKKVVLRGPSLTQSGYGVHCRQIAAWLDAKPNVSVKYQVLPWGDTPWILDKNVRDGLIGRITENTVGLSVSEAERFDVSFQLQLPNEWDPTIAKFNVGMSAVVETDTCNPKWIDSCNKMDMIIVPSNHAAEVLKKTGKLQKPVVVIPESFCDEISMESSTEESQEFSTNFNFLIFGQITGDNPHNDRKNIFFTIKWLCETFKDDKDVGIVIKTNSGRNTNIDKQRTIQIMKTLVNECRVGDFPKIHLIHGEMSDEDVAALYKHKQIKALVSLTRGEGYGLPILEAAASGLPVIATGWSGHTDFLNHGKYINVSYNLKEIHPSRVDGIIFVQGAKWAEVIEEDFKKKVLKFRNSSSTPKQWAEELSTVIKQKYSSSAVFKAYDEATKEFL
jgi:glycosyltransferase involved in cell wall biosynthesis